MMPTSDPLQLARHLRGKFPAHRVAIRRVPLQDRWADCTRTANGSYLIRLDKRVDDAGQTVLLIHEYAHVLSWETDSHPSDHGSRFGLAYARVYQAYLDWLG